MPILARCVCGHKTGVGDALAGRTIRCVKCGGDILVPTAGGGGAASAAGKVVGKSPAALAAARRNAAATPAVTVSPGLLIGAGVAAVLLAIVLVFYFGPYRVASQWSAMAPKAGTDVTDVVMFALQAHQSHGALTAGGPLVRPPAIEGPAVFVPPYMAFTLPRRVIVNGRTSQGGYVGTYDTITGEVTVTVEVGGYSVGGLVDMHKPEGSIHVTGREKDGQVTAEADGEPMTILVPKFKGKFDE